MNQRILDTQVELFAPFSMQKKDLHLRHLCLSASFYRKTTLLTSILVLGYTEHDVDSSQLAPSR